MARITLSTEAAKRAITYSNEAREELMSNINIMDNEVNGNFTGLQDPTFQKYLQLSEQMQELLKQVGQKMDAIAEYCQSVIQWIQAYNEI